MSDRLIAAAVELFTKQGYEGTTVADIADLAGVTSRTFFRYFPNKRETLFVNVDVIRRRIAGSVREGPADWAPVPLTLYAIASCDDLFVRRGRAELRRRDRLIRRSEELQEREAFKLALIAADVERELMGRGTPADVAPLVADIGLVIFKHASRRWLAEPDTSFAELVRQAAGETIVALDEAKAPARIRGAARPARVASRPGRTR